MTYLFEGASPPYHRTSISHGARNLFHAKGVTEEQIRFSLARYLQLGETAHIVNSGRVNISLRPKGKGYLVLVEGRTVDEVCEVDQEVVEFLRFYPWILRSTEQTVH